MNVEDIRAITVAGLILCILITVAIMVASFPAAKEELKILREYNSDENK